MRLREKLYWFMRLREKLLLWFVWHLPRKVVYWCTIRLIANATTGPYSGQIVPALTAMDALQRWEKKPRPWETKKVYPSRLDEFLGVNAKDEIRVL
jgi:hypothetical protein